MLDDSGVDSLLSGETEDAGGQISHVVLKCKKNANLRLRTRRLPKMQYMLGMTG